MGLGTGEVAASKPAFEIVSAIGLPFRQQLSRARVNGRKNRAPRGQANDVTAGPIYPVSSVSPRSVFGSADALPKRIEHRVEPEQCRSERHASVEARS